MRKFIVALLLGTLGTLLIVAQSVRGQPGPPPPPPPFTPATIGPPPPITAATNTPTALPPTIILPVTPLATATPVPLTAAVTVGSPTISPKKSQIITAKTLPGVTAAFTVTFPNGDKKTGTATADTTGTATFSYTQPGSRVTKSSRTAKVSVKVSNTAGQTAKATATYKINYGSLDVTTKPRKQSRGKQEQIYVHTKSSAVVTVQLSRSGKIFQTVTVHTPVKGWSLVAYNIPSKAAKGKIGVKATAKIGKTKAFGSTSFTIK